MNTTDPPRPVRECATCVSASLGGGPALCLWSPPVVSGAQPWPAMARRVEENRDLRGVCGPLGRLWKEKEAPNAGQ